MDAVAAVTLFSAFSWVLGSANQIVGIGSLAVIARRFGENNLPGTENAIKQTLILKFLIAGFMSIFGIISVRTVMHLMHATPDVAEFGVRYGRIFFLGLPFIFASYTIYTALRGVGDSPTAMYVMLCSTGLNILLDWLFILVFKWGVRGAAAATALSGIFAVVMGICILSTGKTNIRLNLKRVNHVDLKMMSKILTIGAPAGIGGISRSLSAWIVATFVGVYGTAVVAGYGIGSRILEFGITFAVGLDLGASAIVGQNLGALQSKRAEQSVYRAVLLAAIIGIALSLTEYFLAGTIIGIFTSEPGARAKGIEFIKIIAIAQPFICISIAAHSAFDGSGNTWPPTIIATIGSWALRIPAILYFVKITGGSERQIWWLLTGTAIVESIITLIWVKTGRWKRKKV
jgi:putative MATE family efflux protein